MTMLEDQQFMPTQGELELVGRVPGQPSRFGRNRRWILGIAAILVALAIWQFAVKVLHVASELVLPAPTAIAKTIGDLVVSGEFWHDMSVSSQEFVLGFGLAVIVGLALGLLMGWFPVVDSVLNPFVHFLNSMPRIALAPLFVIWFGIDIWSKVAVVFFGTVFPIIITTMAGVKNLDPALLRAARSFGTSDLQLFRTVALPGAVPYIISGFRMSVAHGFAGVVVGEFIAAKAGIGLMIVRAAQMYDTATVFAGVMIVAGVGLAFTQSLDVLERRFQAWRPLPS